MKNKRRLGNHNVPSFKELYEKDYDDMEGMSGLGPLDNKPDPEFVTPQEIAREKYLFKLRQVIKGQFYDDSVPGGYDFVGTLQAAGYEGKIMPNAEPPMYVFTKKGSPVVVKFYYSQAGGIALNFVIVEDTSRNQRLFWNRTPPSPEDTHTVQDIISFTFEGVRPGVIRSFSENDDS